MEIVVVLLICTWAVYFLVRHATRGWGKNASCCSGCKNCSEKNKSCDHKDEMRMGEGSE